MLKKEIFALKEACRNIILNQISSLTFFLLICLNIFLIAGSFIFFVNTNYFFEILALAGIAGFYLKLPLINTVDPLLLFQLFITFSLGFCLYYINQIFLERYLFFYLDEIKLMIKLDCSGDMIKRPLLYTAYLINAFAIITVFSIIVLLYNALFQLLAERFSFLLQFTMFNTTLIVILVICSWGAIVAAGHYLFWQNQL